MKTALILITSLVAVSVLASLTAIFVVWRQNVALAFPDFPLADESEVEFMEPDEALDRINELTRLDPDFAEAWEMHVREAADHLTATIAGRHMAGQCSGELEWVAHVPTPDGMDHDAAHMAFRMAVCAEVTARVNAMTGPGAFG